MGIADEEIVHYKGESSGVGVVVEKHGGGTTILSGQPESTYARQWLLSPPLFRAW